ncbi:MAG: hypothetical protein HWN67_04890 [Candidatus Helarchaeota archaeon]|nr:hypothetical protein [Candidatus Helarchaeota archaeon]
MEEEIKNSCAICGEKLIDDKGEQKKFETYASYAKICYDCLFLPIKCVKGNVTLNDVIRRVSLLRRSY